MARIIEPNFINLPKIIDAPKINCEKITIIKEKAGKGTSLKLTISIYSENNRTFINPGIRK
tara:strand:- start:1821 stop:2003 length:183 start_codon:yes stop_codon:yes gene_type:complete